MPVNIYDLIGLALGWLMKDKPYVYSTFTPPYFIICRHLLHETYR